MVFWQVITYPCQLVQDRERAEPLGFAGPAMRPEYPSPALSKPGKDTRRIFVSYPPSPQVVKPFLAIRMRFPRPNRPYGKPRLQVEFRGFAATGLARCLRWERGADPQKRPVPLFPPPRPPGAGRKHHDGYAVGSGGCAPGARNQYCLRSRAGRISSWSRYLATVRRATSRPLAFRISTIF